MLAESLGMQVIFHDVETKLALGNARAAASLDDLLARADIVTLHVPETPATQWMIGSTELAKMRKGAHLINAARVVDIDALDAALASGHVGGAALDVFPVEPKGNGDIFESPLTRHDNVILTPHVGGSTLEAQDNIGVEVAAKLVRYSDNGSTLSAVNFPEVTLPEHEDSLRLLHIHQNVPGVLSRVNEIFSRHNVNIDGQFLRTDPKVGYVVIDITASEAQAAAVRDELAAIPHAADAHPVLGRDGGLSRLCINDLIPSVPFFNVPASGAPCAAWIHPTPGRPRPRLPAARPGPAIPR